MSEREDATMNATEAQEVIQEAVATPEAAPAVEVIEVIEVIEVAEEPQTEEAAEALRAAEELAIEEALQAVEEAESEESVSAVAAVAEAVVGAVAEVAAPVTNAASKATRKAGQLLRGRTSTQPRRTGIIREPAVVRRLEQASSLEKITSNGTIAAAVMVVAALLAVVVANSPFYEIVLEILEAPITFSIGPLSASMSIEAFINDGLMAIFFMLVGIELKYEMKVGQLRRPRQAALPMLAAVGGVAIPALIYIVFNITSGKANGWAVPIATDIAFALGVMSLLGDKIAPQTKVFFQTLAIADDLLAIVVLALFYGQTPDISWCAAAAVVMVILWGINRAKVYSLKPYLAAGILLWFCMYNSGIHATLAGVILAFALPWHSDVRLGNLRDWLGRKARELDERYDERAHVLGQHDFTRSALQVERIMHHVTPPLERAEHNISVIVNFIILPLFAFANAQVRFVGADFSAILSNPVTQGVFCGAVLGKPLGIVAVTYFLVKIGFAKLPKHVTWDQVIAVGIMGGLGFTMSILISGLAYRDPFDVMSAKVAILLGSFAAALLGILFVQIYNLVLNLKSAVPEGDLED